MSTHNYITEFETNASISAQVTDDGEILISQSSYPLSTLMCIPMNIAVKLAEDILEQANAQVAA